MGWLEIILGVIRLATWLVDTLSANRQFSLGQQAEIAKATMELLRRTQQGKAIEEKINAMDDQSVDDLIDRLTR